MLFITVSFVFLKFFLFKVLVVRPEAQGVKKTPGCCAISVCSSVSVMFFVFKSFDSVSFGFLNVSLF